MKSLVLFLAAVASLSGATRHMLIGYGQSTILGNWGCPAVSSTQPYSNQRLNSGNTAFVALIEDGSCVGGTAWNSGFTYQIGALVTSGGSAYIAIAGSTNVTPSGHPATWTLVTTQESPLSSAANNISLL